MSYDANMNFAYLKLDGAISEENFRLHTKQLFRLYGWLAVHHADSRRADAGLPDWIAVKPGRRVLFSELKDEKGGWTYARDKATGQRHSPQRDMLEALRDSRSDVRVFLWRPRHLEAIAWYLSPRIAEDDPRWVSHIAECPPKSPERLRCAWCSPETLRGLSAV